MMRVGRPENVALQRPRRRDVKIAAALTVFLLLAVAVDSSGNPGPWATAAAAVVAAGAGLALAWRTIYLELVTAITLAMGLLLQWLRPELDWPLPALVAVATLATWRPPRASMWGLGGLWLVALAGLFSHPQGDVVIAVAIATTTWALGESARSRRIRREEQDLRVAAEERARIAREMHDLIAHTVSVIVVQAAAGAAVFDIRPEQSRQALVSVEMVGRESLLELRRLLTSPGTGASTDLAPGLHRLATLIAGVRAAGLEVELRQEGLPHTLPASVDLSAYRIVQEALTNTLRHAQATRTTVLVTWSPVGVELDILDDGSGGNDELVHTAPCPGSAGRGLMGMYERAAALGGVVTAGPDPGGGFRVHASLPRKAAS
jgi:signal transduction histidine kinase